MTARFTRTEKAAPGLRRGDYRPFDWRVPDAELDIEILDGRYRVRAALTVERAGAPAAPLRLDGEGLKLLGVTVDGRPAAHKIDKGGLTLRIGSNRARVETIAEGRFGSEQIGLFARGGIVCTQCEPQGFRRIAFFPDRPDVLTRIRTRITADRGLYPVLLGNGNEAGAGLLDGGRHWTAWDDPVPKPSYLFSMVAGKLAARQDGFVTKTGRSVALSIFSDEASLPRTAHALATLKAAMAWDEVRYGRTYDLDRFAIVAIPDYAFGAVEAKGLNIFDAALLLGDSDTALDGELEAITALVAHEYFHNWSGNRVTVRDWFELALKEGLAVFRDQQFRAETGGTAAVRIQDVKALRAGQFTLDEGDSAHPVRPEQCRSLSDLYDATIYTKGAELVWMLRTIAGPEAFRAGLDTFFARHDGSATTCEALVAALAETGAPLDRFPLWYSSAGTPSVTARLEHQDGRATVTLAQDGANPLPIPIATALFSANGKVAERLLVLEEARQKFLFDEIGEPPLLSLNRGFSAPVRIAYAQAPEALHRLATVEDDPVARWDALQALAAAAILGDAETSLVVDAVARAIEDPSEDPGLAAELAALPTQAAIANDLDCADPGAIHRGWRALQAEIGRALAPRWHAFAAAGADGPGARALRVLAFDYLVAADAPGAAALALAEVAGGPTLTERYGTLRALADSDAPERLAALQAFYHRHRSDPASIDKWFAAQAQSLRDDTISAAPRLLTHPDFSLAYPKRLGAIVGGFSANPPAFHHASGRGYRFLADIALAADRIQPELATRLARPLGHWRRIEPMRAALMRAELARIGGTPAISTALKAFAATAGRPAQSSAIS